MDKLFNFFKFKLSKLMIANRATVCSVCHNIDRHLRQVEKISS